jgi:hypothetical protein
VHRVSTVEHVQEQLLSLLLMNHQASAAAGLVTLFTTLFCTAQRHLDNNSQYGTNLTSGSDNPRRVSR